MRHRRMGGAFLASALIPIEIEFFMASKNYHFVTRWRVRGGVKEVTDIISDSDALARWWPSVYLNVEKLEAGDANGVGTVIRLYTKGWLPYTLRWQFRVSAIHADGFSLIASGDFEGRGIWTFKQVGEWVDITYDWKINAEKPLLRYFSFLMKPIFSANHYWAMAKGEESLKLELARRRARTEEERSLIPAPPLPTANLPVPLLLATIGGIAIMSGFGYLAIKLLSRT